MAARFAGVEAAVESLADLESGVRAGIDRAVAKGTDPLVERLDSAESRLGVVADLEGRVSALAAELERRPDGEVVAGELAEASVADSTSLRCVPHEDAVLRDRVDAMAARFAGVEAAVEALADLESGVRAGIDRAVAKGTDPLVERLDSAESRLGVVADLEGRLSAWLLSSSGGRTVSVVAGSWPRFGRGSTSLRLCRMRMPCCGTGLTRWLRGLPASRLLSSRWPLSSRAFVRASIVRLRTAPDPLIARLDSAESRLGVVADLEGRISGWLLSWSAGRTARSRGRVGRGRAAARRACGRAA